MMHRWNLHVGDAGYAAVGTATPWATARMCELGMLRWDVRRWICLQFGSEAQVADGQIGRVLGESSAAICHSTPLIRAYMGGHISGAASCTDSSPSCVLSLSLTRSVSAVKSSSKSPSVENATRPHKMASTDVVILGAGSESEWSYQQLPC
jgi:hypothetical protein